MQARWRWALAMWLVACDEPPRVPVELPFDAQAFDPQVPDAREPDAREDAHVPPIAEDDARATDGRVADSEAGASDPDDAGAPPMDASEPDGARDAGIDAYVPPPPPCRPEDYAASFNVPSTGGEFAICAASGAVVTLMFPYQLAGLRVSARNVDPAARSWTNPRYASAFRDLIELEPTGMTLSAPVGVRLLQGSILAFVFHDDLEVPTPLGMNAYDSAPKLLRLGTLAIVAPEASCETDAGVPSNGWKDTPNQSGMCSSYGGRKNTYRRFECATAPFCHDIAAWCCVADGSPPGGCGVDDIRGLYYARASSDRPSCQGVGGTPYLTSVIPSTLIANHIDQWVEVTGVGLQQGGRVAESTKTEWISSTRVRALIYGARLTAPGLAKNFLHYQNPNPNMYPPYENELHSNGLDITLEAPSVVCPLPPRYDSDPPWSGVCTSRGDACVCALDFDPGDGAHRYAMDCSIQGNTGTCTCTRDGVLTNRRETSPYVCNLSIGSYAFDWREICAYREGFCP